MWQAASDALAVATKEQSLNSEIAEWLRFTIDEILANRKPIEIRAVVKASGRKDSRAITDAKQSAALYMQAIAAEAIDDKSPNITLQTMFNCSSQTIRDWVRRSPKTLWKNFWPNNDDETRLKYLNMRLKHDRKLLREASQTQDAITSRNKATD